MEWSYKMAVMSYRLLQMISYYRIIQMNEERMNESMNQSLN